MVSTFYKGSDGCMLAFDVTDMESFKSMDDWRKDFLDKVLSQEKDFPMVVLGNKIDLSDRQVRWEPRHHQGLKAFGEGGGSEKGPRNLLGTVTALRTGSLVCGGAHLVLWCGKCWLQPVRQLLLTSTKFI